MYISDTWHTLLYLSIIFIYEEKPVQQQRVYDKKTLL